jgi:hypothetical protein
MDLLFKRYANPFQLLDEMIASGRMLEFIERIAKIQSDENEHNTLWEFFLHKVYNKTYAEFLRENKIQHEPPEQAIDFEATINDSFSMLQGFCPE